MTRTWLIRSGVLALLLVSLTALYARGRTTEEADSGPEYQLVERRSLEVTAEAAGLIEPIRLVEVKSKASGEILQLTVESGDVVRRGDLLGRIDPRDVRNALAQAEADLDVAQARLETAESARRRSTELRQANVITEQEFEAAKLEEANARAQFIKARTNLELAQERMGDVTIRAPIDGVIIRKDVETGQIIQSASQNISGGTTVFLMADLTEMQVRTLVSETDLGKIQPGMLARVSVEAYPGRLFQGTVTKIEPQAVVEQNVTMFPVLVQLTNHDGALKPGMNAEVIVEVARRDDAVTVPNAAVVAMGDAVAAGALFGLGEEQMRTALRAGRGARAARAATDGAAPGSGPAAAASDGAPAASAEGRARRGADAAAGGAAAALNGGGSAPSPGGGPAAGAAARPGAPGDVNADAAMASAAAQAGRQGMRGGRNRGVGGGDMRPGVVFVHTDRGVEPRSVLLGVNDWDYTEVLRGLEPGEHVVLISVARLQQQQQDMLNRIRERSGGPFPGGASPGGGGGRGRF